MRRSGTGSPLVLLHGMGSSWRAWRPVVPLLERSHDVWVPTLAGHHGGLALRPGVAPSVAALTDALEDQLDHAGVGRAHVAGNSLGGWIALELARRGRALSVVGLSPAGAWRHDRDLRRVTRLMRLGRALATRRWSQALLTRAPTRRIALRGALERGNRMSAEQAWDMLDDMRRCAVFDGLLDSVRRAGPIRRLTPPDIPIRIAWAAHDRMIPFARYGRPLLDRIPGGELVTLPGVGHVPMHDDPELVARTILEHTT